MPIVPDLPFPKATGNPIRSKDWNDLVYETQRLDTAKVNKAGDGMTGPLTISAALNQAALGVGTATPAARLHVLDGANPTVLRVQSAAASGKSRLELWADAQGSFNEWRPAYLESFDMGSFRGGLSFVTNGSGAANRTSSVEALRLINGRAGFGVNDPEFRIDVADRIRLRESSFGNGSAGLWLFQNAPNEDRAFIGMNGDSAVGLWGNKGAGWALSMDVTTGNVGVRQYPDGAGGAALVVNGRVRDSKLRLEMVYNDSVAITNSTTAPGQAWYYLPGMNMTVNSPGAYFFVRFQMGGIQATASSATTHARGEYRLLVDGAQQAYTLHEYHFNGWELREASLERLIYLSAGSHSIYVQWGTHATDSWPVTLRGCWYNDYRHLMVIEL